MCKKGSLWQTLRCPPEMTTVSPIQSIGIRRKAINKEVQIGKLLLLLSNIPIGKRGWLTTSNMSAKDSIKAQNTFCLYQSQWTNEDFILRRSQADQFLCHRILRALRRSIKNRGIKIKQGEGLCPALRQTYKSNWESEGPISLSKYIHNKCVFWVWEIKATYLKRRVLLELGK